MDIDFPISLRTALRVACWAVVWPLLAAIGAGVLAAAIVAGTFRLVRLRTVGRSALRCPAGHANGTLGRWQCGGCGGQFAGWVGKCGICGDETADWFACGTCALSVVLPWRPPR
jgi:hypothetical protein